MLSYYQVNTETGEWHHHNKQSVGVKFDEHQQMLSIKFKFFFFSYHMSMRNCSLISTLIWLTNQQLLFIRMK
jgi:hypothetical protein